MHSEVKSSWPSNHSGANFDFVLFVALKMYIHRYYFFNVIRTIFVSCSNSLLRKKKKTILKYWFPLYVAVKPKIKVKKSDYIEADILLVSLPFKKVLGRGGALIRGRHFDIIRFLLWSPPLNFLILCDYLYLRHQSSRFYVLPKRHNIRNYRMRNVSFGWSPTLKTFDDLFLT